MFIRVFLFPNTDILGGWILVVFSCFIIYIPFSVLRVLFIQRRIRKIRAYFTKKISVYES